MAEMQGNIEDKIKSVSDTTTEADIATLKTELSANCLAPDKIQSLRAIVEAKENVKEETKVKLRDLLSVCQASPEKHESNDTFTQIFEGTKSEMLSKEHIQFLKSYILGKFEKFNLSVAQKDNLATATVDRLISDKVFSGLVGDISGGITTAVKSMEGGGIVGALNSLRTDDKKADTKEKVESSAIGMEGRIMGIIDRATQPLVDLLSKTPKPTGLDEFLSNPEKIARYDGTGNISPDIQEMSNAEKADYIKNLNNRILEVDGKIVPLETIREKGMDFVATAPDWLQEIFKWLLSLPLIGNLLASFLGYKDGVEATGGIDEELRQRKSIVALRELRTVNPDGTKYEGKYAGKIDILKGKDLSKLSRKKLSDFFAFTKEKGIDSTTPDFWITVFEKGEVTTKNKEGKTLSYKLEKSIETGDLEKDFEGFYSKLNTLQKIAKEVETKEKVMLEENAKSDTETKQKAELAAKIIEAEKTSREILPYKNLSDGLIIDAKTSETLKTLSLNDFRDGTYKMKAETILKDHPKKEQIIGVLTTYSNLLSMNNEKVRACIEGLKSKTTGNIDFQTLSFQRKIILSAAGYTTEFMKQQETRIAEVAKIQEDTNKHKEKVEHLTKRNEAIIEKIASATTFPMMLPIWNEVDIAQGKTLGIDYPAGKIDFDASREEIRIGDKKFSLKVKPFTKAIFTIDDAKITDIRVNGNAFELMGKSEKYGSGEPIKVTKSEMSELLVSLLNGKYDTHKFVDKIAIVPVSPIA